MGNKLMIILWRPVFVVRIIHALANNNTTVIRYDLWKYMTLIIVDELNHFE